MCWFSLMICILRPVPFLTWNWNLKEWNMYKPLCHCRIPWMVVGDQLRWTRKLGEDIPRVRSMILTLTRTGRDVCFVTQFPYMYFDLHLSYDKKCVNKNSPNPIKNHFGFEWQNLQVFQGRIFAHRVFKPTWSRKVPPSQIQNSVQFVRQDI